jgi:predicted acylesterase/phospholipase RssA
MSVATDLLVLVPPAIPILLAALVAGFVPRRAGYALGALATAYVFVVSMVVPPGEYLSTLFLGFEVQLYVVDDFSRLLGLGFGFLGTAAMAYAASSGLPKTTLAIVLSYVGSVGGVIFAGDWLTLLFFWELMAVTSTFVVWAHGGDGQFMEQLAREMEGRGKLWKILDPVFPPRQGFIRGRAVRHRLERSIGRRHFCDLKRPLRIVATDLETLEGTVFDRGEVAEAVHASSAIPGVCVPVEINGRTYIDGGVSDPLPIDILQALGVQRIIAVNTIPPPAYLLHCLERERKQRVKESEWAKAKRILNQNVNYFARGNILDIMLRSIHGAQIRIAEQACNRADIVLRPLSCDARWHDFNNPERYIALGRQVAEKNLESIRAMLKQTGSVHHENPIAPDAMATAA